MNEPATMMNQHQQQQLMNMNQSMMRFNQVNQHQQQQSKPQVIKFNQKKLFANPYSVSQSSDWINFQPQTAQTNRSHWMWQPQQPFGNPNSNPGAMNPSSSVVNKSLAPRNNWKGKKVNNKPNGKMRMEQKNALIRGVDVIGGGGGNLNFNRFNTPKFNELQHQNGLKTRKSFQRRKFDKNNSMNMSKSGNHSRSAPFAPRNTTSFIIRSKKSGGIAPLISPCPVTPSVLPTPILSPTTEILVDMAKEEWGVDGYGSMKGLIRLRSPGHEMDGHDDDDDDDGDDGSSESDVEEHVEMERRLDHDLSRFEMTYNPNNSVNNNVLENRVDDQDSHIAQLEEENMVLKERLFVMERELGDLRRRMVCLERMGNGDRGEVINHESENESGSRGEECNSLEGNDEDFNRENVNGKVENGGYNNNDTRDVESKEKGNKNGDELMRHVNENKDYENRCVDEEEIKDGVDAECVEHESITIVL